MMLFLVVVAYRHDINIRIKPATMAIATTATADAPRKASHPIPQWRDAVAGACAGACSRTIMAPVERVKLLKQLQGSLDAAAASVGNASTSTTRSKSAWAVTVEVYKTQGLLAFWRGNLPNVLRVSGTAAINMTMMDYYKKIAVAPWLEHNLVQRHMTTTEQIARRRRLTTSFVSGGLAGATGTTILYPIEFLRTRLAMDTGTAETRKYKGMYDVLKSIVRSDGVLGLYQGYGVALVGGVLYRIVFLGGYDALKSEIVLRKQKLYLSDLPASSSIEMTQESYLPQLSWGERIASAQAISLTAGTLVYPFDSVRRRMMMQAGLAASERLYRNSFHCIAMIARREGIRGFYLGLGPNVIRSIGGALLLVAYDTFKVML
jgi:solute carrier family 25 (adenine nucleotide translocator) protein 4/5/6/31